MNPECDSQEALWQLIDRCAALLSAVDDMLGNWKPGEGLPMRTAADMLLQTVLARSTRTYRAAMLVATEGMGEQTRMLGRSLFEDTVDAHWIALNPDLAVERAAQHWRYSLHVRIENANTFPERFPQPVPPLDPPMGHDERAKLKALFRNGTGSWTGVGTRERWETILGTRENGMERSQARFVNEWLHKTSHETLHLSSRSLHAGGPRQVGDDLVLATNATPDQLGPALFCAFWTYVQTLSLLAQEFELQAWERIHREVVVPGFAAFAAAGPAALGAGV